MSNEGVCRTAPATPGLLISLLGRETVRETVRKEVAAEETGKWGRKGC